MAAREIAVKKYVVKLSAEERERLNTLIQSGKHPTRKLTRARILLKADAGEAGEGWRTAAGPCGHAARANGNEPLHLG